MSFNQIYKQYTTDQLKALLSSLDSFDIEAAEISSELSVCEKEYKNINHAELHWAQFYEEPFEICLAKLLAIANSLTEIQAAAASENKSEALNDLSDNIYSNLDSALSNLNELDKKIYITQVASISLLVVNSLRCLMIYGQYINELIKTARESQNSKLADKALLQAIRIDPTVLGCPTGLNRLSRAIFFNHADFLRKIQNALSRKLGVRENKNYRKIRFILQVLHESGGEELSDKELKELFVKQLNVYSDPQSSSEKNLKEFAYNFKKQKSTI